MSVQKFDYKLADSQATVVKPVSPELFDYQAYADYEASLFERCHAFWSADSGVLVYRRMRVAEVFSYGCKDMKKSLQWQLGALQKSMEFKADVPNFLEPWYGHCTVAGAFGCDYIWQDSQAPAVRPKFQSVKEALSYPVVPVSQSSIGKVTLDMIDYFMDKTDGRLPISLCDVQSPLNIACSIVDTSRFFMDMIDDPEGVKKLLKLLAELLVEFTEDQIKRIGKSLVWPGHGFASSRGFSGLGMSDDNAIMISSGQYLELAATAVERAAESFGDFVFHSCGNWSDKIDAVKQVAKLRMVDAAFSPQTDPDPNPPELFAKGFANTGIVVNARIVGDLETVNDVVQRLYKPGMKIIVVTYCKTPQEQARVYKLIHEICKPNTIAP